MKNSGSKIMTGGIFKFKQFIIKQDKTVFKVGTDGVLLGASANLSGVKNILDIGTGTGLIALMLAQRSDAVITAIEPDYDSCVQACENVLQSEWNDRIKVLNCSVQDFDPGDEKFDLIVTNPPWFVDSLRNPDPARAMARHNTRIDHSDILAAAGRLLGVSGRLQLIMPYAEGNIFIAEATAQKLYCNEIIKIRPLPSSPVKRIIIRFSRERQAASERFLTIEKGNRHDYTEDYMRLTGDFYTKF